MTINNNKLYQNTCAIDMERSVLCTVMLDPHTRDVAIEKIDNDDLFSDINFRKIWKAIKSLYKQDKSIDLLIIIEELKQLKYLDETLKDVYVFDIVNAPTCITTIQDCINVLRDKFVLRSILKLSEEANGYIQKQNKTPTEILQHIDKSISDLLDTKTTTNPELISTLLSDTFKQIECYTKKSGVSGIPTGFDKIDQMTTGLHSGELFILASRPGMGKTSLALSISLNLCKLGKEDSRSIVFFSLEMSKQQLIQRLLCSEALVDLHRLRSGTLTKSELEKIGSAASRLYSSKLYLDDQPGLSILQLKSKCKRIKSNGGIDLIIIDYLQLMEPSEKSENRQQEVSKISRSLKCLAKDLGVPIIALSQLNRAVESRVSNDRRPQLSDLRESGAIEQDADSVLFIYRESVYKPEEQQLRGIAEIIIAKQRNGATGTVKLQFDECNTGFYNLVEDNQPKVVSTQYKDNNNDDYF